MEPMIVFVVVEWVDGIPEFIRVYSDESAANQYIRVLGRPQLQVMRVEVV